MADGLTLSRLRDAYAAASLARKLLWGAVILLLLALPSALFWQDARPPQEYRVLFAKLSDKDGGEVVEALERLKIPYRLSEPDGSVQVPSHQLHVARYKLAALGLPKGDKPAGEAEGPRFGLSPFQEQLDYQRGLEADLARSVETIESVESARVHLALPKQSAFLREPVPPTASVLIKLKPGAGLNEGQAQAVRRIVAGSVPGMDSAQVSIVDQHGALLEASEAAGQAQEPEVAAALPASPVFPDVIPAEPVANDAIQVPPPAARPPRPAAFSQPELLDMDDELLPVYAGLVIALLMFLLLLRVRARQRKQLEAALAAEGPQAGEIFDARLDALRQQVLADPKVTASVVKIWIRNRAGMEKSAALLLALGEEAAAQVFRYLSPFEVGELGRVMREMGALPRGRVEAVIDEYESEAARQTGIGADADEFLDAALTRALGDERGRMLLTRIASAGGNVQQLAWKEPEEVAALLKDEHPQLVAAVLAQLDRSHAAATLEWLPEPQRQEVVSRLAEWHGAPAEALREMEDWLAHRLQGEESDKEGASLVADLLSRMSPAAREELESGLSENSPQLLEQLKAQQLDLNDLARLSSESRTQFFKAVPGQTLLLALKGADPELVQELLAHMPDTAARRLRDDLESLGAARVADIESAQAETVRLLRELASEGRLSLVQSDSAQPEMES